MTVVYFLATFWIGVVFGWLARVVIERLNRNQARIDRMRATNPEMPLRTRRRPF